MAAAIRSHIERAGARLTTLPRSKSEREEQSDFALWLAVCVLRKLKEYGITPWRPATATRVRRRRCRSSKR